MNIVEVAIEITIGKEGKYSNHPSDSGGETMWGITKAVAARHGWNLPMKDLPREEAVRIYREEYFLDPKIDWLIPLSQSITKEVFDSGVNCGTGTAIRWLQASLNRLNQKSKLYKDIDVDGGIGPETLKALKTYLAHRGAQGELVLLRMLNCEQGAHYNKLADAREKDEDFIFGWYLNRVVI